MSVIGPRETTYDLGRVELERADVDVWGDLDDRAELELGDAHDLVLGNAGRRLGHVPRLGSMVVGGELDPVGRERDADGDAEGAAVVLLSLQPRDEGAAPAGVEVHLGRGGVPVEERCRGGECCVSAEWDFLFVSLMFEGK